MPAFEAELPLFPVTLVATAVLVAGDPVTAAGAKATDAQDFYGIARADAAIGEVVPVMRWGIASVQIDTSSSGVTAGDLITYATDGYDDAGAAQGFAIALDTGVALGFIRIDLGGFAPKEGAVLTTVETTLTNAGTASDWAIQALTSSTPFGFVTAAEGETVVEVVVNNQLRINEIESRLQALGLIL